MSVVNPNPTVEGATLVTFTGIDATVELLAPFLGQPVVITSKIPGDRELQAFGVFGSAVIDPMHHRGISADITFSGGGSFSWHHSAAVTVDLLDQTADLIPPVAQVGSRSDNDKTTITLYTANRGDVIVTEDVHNDDNYSAYPGHYTPRQALSAYLGRDLLLRDIVNGGQRVANGETWDIFHVTR
ncbi:hypothetical protein [Leifsonia sp. Leaf264]|uniref:hypothetical protein n=1 Tax=Leifsonia sp. Leaf264 TaxID=1736314 RepID=UPI0006F4B832|nr:hypothetical protein [Leifsonia sp. Leaf264]KQO98507.1 hypothetical protein ASF30_10620 [Leifsonia sp. Leaf264]